MRGNWVTLNTIAEINPPLSKAVESDDTVAFLPMAAVSEDGFLNRVSYRPASEVVKGYTPFQEGDVLLAKITPCMENGKAAIARPLETEFGFGSTEFHVLRAKGDNDPRFLFHAIWNPRFRFEAAKNMTGSGGQKRVPSAFLERYRLVCPAPAEQKRIAAILDQADSIRRKRQQAIRLTDDFLRSVFLDMFGDPVTNPKGWQKIPLGELLRVKSGNALLSKNMASDGIFPVYGGNGISGYHDEFMFAERRIVLGRVGVYCGAVHYTEPNSWITDNALYVEKIHKPFDDQFLLASLRLANLNQYAGQAAQPLISGGRIYPIEILDPPLALQNTFARAVAKAGKIRSVQERLKSEAAALFQSLQYRAFTGQL